MPPRPPRPPPPVLPLPLIQPRPPPAACPAAAGRAPEAARQRLLPCRLRRVLPCPQVGGQPGPAGARMEVHAVRQPRRTRLTRCHLAPLPPLPHPILHSFPLGTSPTGLHNPAALRRCLRLRHTPPRVLSPRRNRLRRHLLGPFRPRGDSRERLLYQLAGVGRRQPLPARLHRSPRLSAATPPGPARAAR